MHTIGDPCPPKMLGLNIKNLLKSDTYTLPRMRSTKYHFQAIPQPLCVDVRTRHLFSMGYRFRAVAPENISNSYVMARLWQHLASAITAIPCSNAHMVGSSVIYEALLTQTVYHLPHTPRRTDTELSCHYDHWDIRRQLIRSPYTIYPVVVYCCIFILKYTYSRSIFSKRILPLTRSLPESLTGLIFYSSHATFLT